MALGSYNKFNRNFVRDCYCIVSVGVFTSFFSGLAIFSVLGYMSYESGLPISEVAQSGTYVLRLLINYNKIPNERFILVLRRTSSSKFWKSKYFIIA